MLSASWAAFLLFLPLASASAHRRWPATICGQYETLTSGSYTLLTDLWGEANATLGSQCSTLESVDGDIVTWYTEWTWKGGHGIKSFSNVQLSNGMNQQLSAISAMPSKWDWSQSDNAAIKADVAYDLFTSYTPGGSAVNEIMIWLANFNSEPISYKYHSNGLAIPVATNIVIGGYAWNLYSGFNEYNKVYSFLPVRGRIHSFNGDIHRFFNYLIKHGYIEASQYLTTAQAGTEATSGSATFRTSAYSLAVY